MRKTNNTMEGFEEDSVNDDAKNVLHKLKNTDKVLEMECKSSEKKNIMPGASTRTAVTQAPLKKESNVTSV